MNIIDQYLLLTKQNRFSDALPLIEEIVGRNPNSATSQFNYGICLAELGRHKEAAQAFLRAYSLSPNDGGSLYRACLALAASADTSGLLEVFQRECALDPEMIRDFLDEKRFASFWELPDFKALKNKWTNHS